MRILIIEDEETLRRQVCDRLTRAGYRVDGTGDGAEAAVVVERADLAGLAVVDPGTVAQEFSGWGQSEARVR